jgi:beta-glucosidase-like glycosyl hydrolase
MDIFDRSSADGAHVNEWDCMPAPDNYNQIFTFDQMTGQIRSSSKMLNKCVTLTSADPMQGLVEMQPCSDSMKNFQSWALDNTSGLIQYAPDSTLCLNAAVNARNVPCETRPGAPWCNLEMTHRQRASELTAHLNLTEKVMLLSTNSFVSDDDGLTPGVRRLGITSMQFHSEGLHGIRTNTFSGPSVARSMQGAGASTGTSGAGAIVPESGLGSKGSIPKLNTTLFPQATAMASTFNASLWRAMGRVMQLEARAVYNEMVGNGQVAGKGGGLFYWGPTHNIATRDPRWGRGQESIGSSVLINGAYSTAFIRSFQGNVDGLPAAAASSMREWIKRHMGLPPAGHDDALPAGDDDTTPPTDDGGGSPDAMFEPVPIAACSKHAWAYTLEASDGFTRHTFTARVSPEDALLTYLAIFRTTVSAGRPLQIMCSYNAVSAANSTSAEDNVPTCLNRPVQEALFRGEWGYDGMLVSDCDAVGDAYTSHHFVSDAAHAAALAVKAGTDVDCGATYHALSDAVSQGLLTEADLDRAVERALMTRIRLGEFDPVASQPLTNLTVASDCNTESSRALALQAAQQAIVLVANRNGTLPAPVPKTGSSIAVIGPFAIEGLYAMGSKHDYSPAMIWSPSAALQQRAAAAGFTVAAVEGSGVTAAVKNGITEAVAAAKAASMVVLTVGIDGTVEHEGGDRTSLALPQPQLDLIDAVLAAVSPSTRVVLAMGHGGPVSYGPSLLNDTRIGAVLDMLEGGQDAGIALFDVIFGDVNPSAGMPYQILPASYVNLVNMSDMSMRAGPGRTFRYTHPSYPQELPFGYWNGYASIVPTAVNVPAAATASSGFAMHATAQQIASAAKDPAGGAPGGFAGLPMTITLENKGTVAGSRPVMAFISRRRSADGATAGPVLDIADVAKVAVPAGGSQTVTLDLARPLVLAEAKLGSEAAILGAVAATDRPGTCVFCEYSALADGTDAAVVAAGVYDVWVGGFGAIPAPVLQARLDEAGEERNELEALLARASSQWDGGAIAGTITITGDAAETVWVLPEGALPH